MIIDGRQVPAVCEGPKVIIRVRFLSLVFGGNCFAAQRVEENAAFRDFEIHTSSKFTWSFSGGPFLAFGSCPFLVDA